MFHPKDTTNANDVSATMEYNELKQEEKIKEFQNAQGDLIFECFQDEVNWKNKVFRILSFTFRLFEIYFGILNERNFSSRVGLLVYFKIKIFCDLQAVMMVWPSLIYWVYQILIFYFLPILHKKKIWH